MLPLSLEYRGFLFVRFSGVWVGREIVPQLRALAALADDVGLVFSIYTEGLPDPYNSSSGGFNTLFWPPQVLRIHGTYAYKQGNTRTHKIDKYFLKLRDKNGMTNLEGKIIYSSSITVSFPEWSLWVM